EQEKRTIVDIISDTRSGEPIPNQLKHKKQLDKPSKEAKEQETPTQTVQEIEPMRPFLAFVNGKAVI
ncbi:MAG: hypothetical protein ACK55Z_16065, partial [bacterium]